MFAAEEGGGFVVVAAHIDGSVVEAGANLFAREPVGQRLVLGGIGEAVFFLPGGVVQRIDGRRLRRFFIIVGNLHAIVFRQRFEAADKALCDEAEFPGSVATVAFAEDERGFLPLTEVFDRAMQGRRTVFADVEAEVAEAGKWRGAAEGDGDALDVRRLTGEVKVVFAAALAGMAGDAAVVAARLVVEDHVVVATHAAIGGKAIGGAINRFAAVNAEGEAGWVADGGIGAGGEGLGGHGFLV